jgi:hypothetical protein
MNEANDSLNEDMEEKEVLSLITRLISVRKQALPGQR